MANNRRVIVNKGWSLENSLHGEHHLLLLNEEEPARLSWDEFGMSSGPGRRLCPYSGLWPLRWSTIVPGRTEIIYAEVSGLWCLNWQTRCVDSHLKVDLDNYDLAGLWTGPSNERLYYVLSKKALSHSKMVATLRKQHVEEERSGPGELFVLESVNNIPRRLLELDPSTILSSLVVVDSKMYALTNQHELLQIDLKSMASRKVGKMPIIAEGLAPGSDGELLVSGALGTKDSGIYQFDYSGRMIRRLSNFGYRPSISSKGKFIAFLAPDGVCLTSGNGSLNQIFTLEQNLEGKDQALGSPMFQEGCKIAWCKCGAHFALKLPEAILATGNWQESPRGLLIGDVAAKQIALYNARPFDYLWVS